MREKLIEMTDEALKATYLMYRDGDDEYSFIDIKEEYTRRDKNKLWGKHTERSKEKVKEKATESQWVRAKDYK